ncbi:unnamed protein product [Adineta steineri]|uniref:NHL repeat containing protein n=1 Tax=Adineta steineri TaxID=433720 RepID=A0A816ELJ4_9BILA|nr:unnamed protein product [Adineta steineri]CAF1649590.1 unnamed protein product [Adineta steineri]
MNIDDTVDVDESIVVNLNGTRLQTLFEHFRKRKLILIIVLIILIVAIIAIPTIIVTVNKGKGEKTSTIQISTVEIITTTAETTATEELIPSVVINENTKWKQSAITVAGGNGQGNQLNQLSRPLGIYVDDDSESIYIADIGNDRVVRWKFGEGIGEIVADEKGQDSNINQFNQAVDIILDKEKKSVIICDPSYIQVVQWSLQNSQDKQILISDITCWGLAMDSNRNLYIPDWERHQVRRWQQGDKEGTIVAGGNGQGNHLNQLNEPHYIFADKNHSIYVADYLNNRVMKWMKNATEGICVAPGEASSENPNSLIRPMGVIVDDVGNIYVSSEISHQITRWSPGAIEGVPVIGEKQSGNRSTQLFNPRDLSFDRQGNLYVVDRLNHRIQKFVIDRD